MVKYLHLREQDILHSIKIIFFITKKKMIKSLRGIVVFKIYILHFTHSKIKNSCFICLMEINSLFSFSIMMSFIRE